MRDRDGSDPERASPCAPESVDFEAGWRKVAATSPTRGGTLRWGELPPGAIVHAPPAAWESPTRGGTLRWDELPPGAIARAPPPASPTRGGTLRWADRIALVPPAPSVAMPPIRTRTAIPSIPREAPPASARQATSRRWDQRANGLRLDRSEAAPRKVPEAAQRVSEPPPARASRPPPRASRPPPSVRRGARGSVRWERLDEVPAGGAPADLMSAIYEAIAEADPASAARPRTRR